MDCSWLLEDEKSSSSESDSEEAHNELEERLYSIVHHNDLSQPLPPELAKHYSLHCADNGDVLVTLKNSLEDFNQNHHVVLPENPQVINVSVGLTVKDPVNDDVAFISSVSNTQSPKKSFRPPRYSDVNLDKDNLIEKPETTRNIPYLDYFNCCESLFKSRKAKRFYHLTIPKAEDLSDWKSEANSSFISLEHNSLKDKKVVKELFLALKKVNSKERHGLLYDFAYMLYRRKNKTLRRKERAKKRKASNSYKNEVNLTPDILREVHKYQTENKLSDPEELAYSTTKCNDLMNGSISLNITPFRPDHQVPVVDLVSEEETTIPSIQDEIDTNCSTKLPNSHIPTKWTKKMIKFYTKPSKTKMKLDLNKIIEDMKKTTTAKDWWLDPRDLTGHYQSPNRGGKYAGIKCHNCYQRGHLLRDCPSPRKIPTCTLCGQHFHSEYSCPNKVCIKCGDFSNTEVFGGECNICYYSSFDYDVVCELCGQLSHRSAICTDYWRSFHSTIEGEKKIPEKDNTNKRKHCSNCARKGHFSHMCPFLQYSGQQNSPFVSNYATGPLELGFTEISIPSRYSKIIYSKEADDFMQNLSNTTKAMITFDQVGTSLMFHVNGTFEQCRMVKSEIECFVNTKKRKRFDHFPMKKKRRTR